MSNQILAKFLNISESTVAEKLRQIVDAFRKYGDMTNNELIEHILADRKKEDPNKWFTVD